MIFRRILGAVMLLMGLLGLALSVVGAINSPRLIDNIGSGLETSLALTSQNLDTAKQTLLLAKTTMGQVNDGLETVESAAINVSQTISETRPLLNEVGQVVSHDLPNSVEAFQAAVPDMAHAAAVIDDTLTTLSNFRIDQRILGFPIRFDLGIRYAPEEPFDESVNRIGESLEGVPAHLRGLEDYIDVTDANLEIISQDLVAISKDLDTISDGFTDVEPLLEDYIRAATEAGGVIEQTQAGLSAELETVKLVVTVLMIWIGAAQIVPLYLGWELITGRRDS